MVEPSLSSFGFLQLSPIAKSQSLSKCSLSPCCNLSTLLQPFCLVSCQFCETRACSSCLADRMCCSPFKPILPLLLVFVFVSRPRRLRPAPFVI